MTLRNRHRVVWTEEALRCIRRSDVDLCIWRRGFETPFANWCQHVTGDVKLDVDETVSLHDAWPVERWLSPLPACEHRAQLAADLRARLTNFGQLLGVERARVQLHRVHEQTCPKFHVDSVTVRLICTWAGPATEWIGERDLDRSRLRVTNMEGTRTHHLERFDVALMKGSAWPGNASRGVVHRSPHITDVPRLVFTIDGSA